VTRARAGRAAVRSGAAAISCYYWFRVPALVGLGIHPGDGMLADLGEVLPAWFPLASQIATTSLFFWWLVWRRRELRSWCRRPPFAPEAGQPRAGAVPGA
jgi:hypothetical protein